MELYEQYEQVELTHAIFEEVDSQDWDALAYKNSAFFGAKVASFYKDKELQAKDTTIKEQAEKIEKLTGLLKDEITKEYLNPEEEDRELLGLMIHDYENETERFLSPQQAADDKWNEYKEQHGI